MAAGCGCNWVALDPRRRAVHLLNETAARLWELLAAPNSGLLNQLFRLVTGAEADEHLFNIYSLTGIIFVISCYTFPFVFVLVANALDRIPGFPRPNKEGRTADAALFHREPPSERDFSRSLARFGFTEVGGARIDVAGLQAQSASLRQLRSFGSAGQTTMVARVPLSGGSDPNRFTVADFQVDAARTTCTCRAWRSGTRARVPA